MTTEELLAYLAARNVTLWIDGDRLQVQGAQRRA